VTLDTMTPQASVNESGYVSVPVNVVVDGHYFGIERFLRLVRTQVRLDKSKVSASGRLLDVQGVQLQQTEPAPTVTATLSLRAFYYSPTATQAPATTTDTTTTSD
jgi:Tfp pilus assembly protein PilO